MFHFLYLSIKYLELFSAIPVKHTHRRYKQYTHTEEFICVAIYKDIYYEQLICVTMEVQKFHNQQMTNDRPNVWWCISGLSTILSQQSKQISVIMIGQERKDSYSSFWIFLPFNTCIAIHSQKVSQPAFSVYYLAHQLYSENLPQIQNNI